LLSDVILKADDIFIWSSRDWIQDEANQEAMRAWRHI
jgi:hypothetical protein